MSGKIKNAFICSRGTLDGAYPALILGINTARMGNEAYIFFTFDGLNVLRKGKAARLKYHMPGFMGAIPGMSILATWMMKRRITDISIPDVDMLLEMATHEGVTLIACNMTMGMMRLGKEDLIPGLEVMTAEEYLKLAGTCSIKMFT